MNFTIIKYPDGQISVKLINKGDNIHTISERVDSYESLFLVKSIKNAIESASSLGKLRGISLFIPCLFGQRSDRRFDFSQSFDLKIIADFINSCNFRKVEIFDPHSDVSLALINNSYKRDSFEYVHKAFRDIGNTPILISPDAGAYKKVFDYASLLNVECIGANKHRDKNGNIDLIFSGDVLYKECLIVDDLADGGYTFVLLAKRLKELGAAKVYLYVSHAYFNKGFDELGKYIDHIFCTNSVKDIDCGFDTLLNPNQDFITQYKII
jgi:ribose-phosphate pyrophosphokinase